MKVLGVLHPAQHHVADVERPLLDVLNVVTPEILEIVSLASSTMLRSSSLLCSAPS